MNTTAIAPLEPLEIGYLTVNDPTGGRLNAWASAMVSASELGAALAGTSFVPAIFRNKPEECAAAILFGDELGMTPMQAFQSVFVISGKVGMYARTMVALCLAAGHEVETVSKTDAKCVVRGRRKGSETWTEEVWTTERARRAQYTSNKKYETDPQAMLYARAAADVCRQIAPDTLSGLTLTVEEIELDEAAPTTAVSRKSSTTAISRGGEQGPTFEQPVEAPVAPSEPTDEPPVPDPREANGDAAETPRNNAGAVTLSDAQTRMIGALMKELHITERADALTYCADVIGRPIGSRKELTKHEASKVIDSLAKDKEAATPPPTEQERAAADEAAAGPAFDEPTFPNDVAEARR